MDPEAAPHPDELRYVHVDALRDLGARVRDVLRVIRAASGSEGQVKGEILKRFSTAKFMPPDEVATKPSSKTDSRQVKPLSPTASSAFAYRYLAGSHATRQRVPTTRAARLRDATIAILSDCDYGKRPHVVDAAANGTAAPLSELTAEEPRVMGASTERSSVKNEAPSGRRSLHC